MPLVIVTYYHFIRAYENKPGGLGVYIGYALVLILLVFSLSGHVVKDAHIINGALIHDIAPWNYVLGVIVVPYLAIIFYTLARRYRRSDDAIDRNKTTYLLTGWGAALVITYITAFTPLTRSTISVT
jgi:membrane protein implicated in regulation of membrane protease activity